MIFNHFNVNVSSRNEISKTYKWKHIIIEKDADLSPCMKFKNRIRTSIYLIGLLPKLPLGHQFFVLDKSKLILSTALFLVKQLRIGSYIGTSNE